MKIISAVVLIVHSGQGQTSLQSILFATNLFEAGSELVHILPERGAGAETSAHWLLLRAPNMGKRFSRVRNKKSDSLTPSITESTSTIEATKQVIELSNYVVNSVSAPRVPLLLITEGYSRC